MLLIIIAWLYATSLVFIYGFFLVRLLRKVFKISDDSIISPYFTLWAGLVCITTLLMYVSLFLKIDLLVHFIFLCFAIIYLLVDYRHILNNLKTSIDRLRDVDKSIYILFFIFMAGLALFCSIGPSDADTPLYHAQMIRWIKEYPVVPGLGNLHARLAFNPSWFIFHALFDVSYFEYKSFHLVNGMVLLFSFAFALSGLDTLRKGRYNLVSAIKFTSFFPLVSLTYIVASTSTDIVSALAVLTILFASLKLMKGDKGNVQLTMAFITLAISAFAVTTKLSVAPVVLFPLYFLYRSFKNSRADRGRVILAAIIIPSLISTPWIIRNIVLSGHMVFPFPPLDIFDFDWEIPMSLVVDTKSWIDSWARIPGKRYEEVLGYGIMHWLPTWFENVSSDDIFQLLETSLVCYFLYVILCFRSALKVLSKYYVLYSLLLIGLAFWFISAPAARFGYGFLASFSTLLLASALVGISESSIFKKNARLIHMVLPLLLIIFFILMTPTKRSIRKGHFKDITLTSLTSYITVGLKERPIKSGQSVYVPSSGELCGNSSLPCTTPAHYNPNLEMRGKSLGDGFRFPIQDTTPPHQE